MSMSKKNFASNCVYMMYVQPVHVTVYVIEQSYNPVINGQYVENISRTNLIPSLAMVYYIIWYILLGMICHELIISWYITIS